MDNAERPQTQLSPRFLKPNGFWTTDPYFHNCHCDESQIQERAKFNNCLLLKLIFLHFLDTKFLLYLTFSIRACRILRGTDLLYTEDSSK